MANSLVSVLLHVYDGFRKDILRTYPEVKGVDLDFERITLGSQTRGLAYFTLDLPSLESLLLRGLESGRLELEGPLSQAVSKRTRVPRLLSGLWLRVFDNSSCLRPEPDINAILDLRQVLTFGKKLLVECTADRREAVIQGYHDVEKALRLPSLGWSQDRLSVGQCHNHHLVDCVVNGLHNSGRSVCNQMQSEGPELPLDREDQEPARELARDQHLLLRTQQVADILMDVLGPFEPLGYSSQLELDGHGTGFKHGPGAVAERLSQGEKSSFPYWPAKLEGTFPFDYCAKMPNDPRGRPLNHEPASRLYCVPKTAKGPRLIAAEPVAHMWCQQLIWSWLRKTTEDRFYGFFVNFRRQDLSGDMVLKASLDRSLATVDLSDASDRLSCWTVERMFRRNPTLLTALHAARTRYLRDDNLKGTTFLRLRKFASQGTASTFPVQSLVFLIIALASCFDNEEPTWEKIWRLRSQVRVFGDDIILPRHGYARLCRIMDRLQLKVNTSKSYVHGKFRESCGQDGYAGFCVTPVKPKTIVADGPASSQAVIDTSNNLFNKGYWNASHNLISQLPDRVQRALRIVGILDAGFPGLSSFVGSDESHLTKRWNSRLHRYEGRVFQISGKLIKQTREGYVPLLDFSRAGYNPWYPRVVSDIGRSRKIRSDLLWEPLNMDAHGNVSLPIDSAMAAGSGRTAHILLPKRDR